MIVRIQKSGVSFRGSGLYYLHDKAADASIDKALKPKSAERLWFTETRNCMNSDPVRALDEMWGVAADQSWLKMQAGVKRGGRVCEEPVKTMSLSWHKDDAPDVQHMIESADAFLKHMGWDAHQAVFVGHNDTDHKHVHIVLNRVNPDTGRTVDDFREQKRAQEWALQYEREHEQIRCEQREINAGLKSEKAAAHEIGDVKQHEAADRPQPMPQRAANDHLPHNVIMISRPHEQAFNAQEQVRAEQDQTHRAELKTDQRAEREAFFKDGARLFKATRHAVYDEVRKEYVPEWRQFYKDTQAAQKSADAASDNAVSRSMYFAKDGKWDEAREAFADRDSVRDAVAHDLSERKADLKSRQNADLRERQRDACDALRDVRDVQYQELLQRQRDERAAVQAGATLDALGISNEAQRDSGTAASTAQAANENRPSHEARPPERAVDGASIAIATGEHKNREIQAGEVKTPELAAPSIDMGAGEVAPRPGPVLEAPETIHQPTDLAAGAIGSLANILADALGDMISPTPPEVRAEQAKEAAKRNAEREAAAPEKDDKAGAYARIIDNAVRMLEEQRAREGDAYWKERDRGKGWERDQ